MLANQDDSSSNISVAAAMSIGDVERETGLTKDVLRIWERRYGFPKPERGANGSRLYPRHQVERLRQIKRLLDSGFRPGKVIQRFASAGESLRIVAKIR